MAWGSKSSFDISNFESESLRDAALALDKHT
jgi:hypothetical protein